MKHVQLNSLPRSLSLGFLVLLGKPFDFGVFVHFPENSLLSLESKG